MAVRGAAFGVLPATVGLQAIATLTSSPVLPAAAVPINRIVQAIPAGADRVQVVSRVHVIDGITVQIPVLPAAPATVRELSAASAVDPGTIRWANDLGENQEPVAGQVLVVPPSRGGLIWRQPGEGLDQFARRTGVPLATLTAYNAHPEAGSRHYLQVPLGTPGMALPSSEVVMAAPGYPAVPSGQRNHGVDRFPYGQCTWFAASKRDVSWMGDAGQWLRAARGIRPEGNVPVVGAIAVQTGVSAAGHVSYVQTVNDDGSFRVAEMNYAGWGVVSQRTLRVRADGVTGFIY